MLVAEIKVGMKVKLKSGVKVVCHQHGSDDGRLVLVHLAPPMPQKSTDEFKGRALGIGHKYLEGENVDFCWGCIWGPLPPEDPFRYKSQRGVD